MIRERHNLRISTLPSSEDVEEEQLDGGIRRQWLSQFEFTKLLTSSPSPPFFSWLLLWYSLPAYEKGEVTCMCHSHDIARLSHNYHMTFSMYIACLYMSGCTCLDVHVATGLLNVCLVC